MTRTRKITPCIYVSLEDMRTGTPLYVKATGFKLEMKREGNVSTKDEKAGLNAQVQEAFGVKDRYKETEPAQGGLVRPK